MHPKCQRSSIACPYGQELNSATVGTENLWPMMSTLWTPTIHTTLALLQRERTPHLQNDSSASKSQGMGSDPKIQRKIASKPTQPLPVYLKIAGISWDLWMLKPLRYLTRRGTTWHNIFCCCKGIFKIQTKDTGSAACNPGLGSFGSPDRGGGLENTELPEVGQNHCEGDSHGPGSQSNSDSLPLS